MKLYEMADAYTRLLDLADDPDVEFEDGEMEELLDSAEEQIEGKVENCCKVIKSMEAQANALREEEKRLADRRRGLEKNVDSLKRYVEGQLSKAGLRKVSTELFTTYTQKNPPSVEITDAEAIPGDYWEPQEPRLKKKELIEQCKNGEEIPGVRLTQGESLRIR